MSGFFQSDMVKDSIIEMTELQQKLGNDMMNLSRFDNDQKRKHIEDLKTFLEKQKLFFFRVSLSDDPDAIKIKEKVLEAAKMFGFNEINGMDMFFDRLDKTIKNLESTLDK
tara:strand:- start:67 stop:399 length:333 start_codon:yes stop_codon:yes gene_type:complete